MSSIRTFIKNHSLAVYFILSFAWSWGCWSKLVLFASPDALAKGPDADFLVLALTGGIGPSLAGFLVTWLGDGRDGLKALFTRFTLRNVRLGWIILCILLVPFLSLAVLAANAAFGLPSNLGDIASRLPLALAWPLFSSLGEEFGWRGFALSRMKNTRSMLQSALLLGLIWGLWHLPADFIGLRSQGWWFIPNFILTGPILLTAMNVIMSWVYQQNKENVLLMVIIHYTITCSAILFTPLTATPFDSLLYNLISCGVYWVAAGLLILREREWMKKKAMALKSQ